MRFVKNLRRRLQSVTAFAAEGRPVRLFCQDEARVGLHLPSYRRVTARGACSPGSLFSRSTRVLLAQCGAVEPRTGESFYLEMPALDTDCFSVFLRELARAYPESLCAVVLDNAPAHVANAVPENVVLVPLPAYSPELNPAEVLWREVRRRIREVRRRIDVFDEAVRTKLSALREHVAEIVRGFTPEQLQRLTGFGYLLDAANAL